MKSTKKQQKYSEVRELEQIRDDLLAEVKELKRRCEIGQGASELADVLFQALKDAQAKIALKG